MTMENKILSIMNTKKILKITLALFVSIVFFSCVEDDDYTIPVSLGADENAGLQLIIDGLENGSLTEISVTDLLALYTGSVTLIESDIVVKGYVTSSDRTGNFYKEFYMQDAVENPTAAIGVVLNQVDSYNQFNLGREVYINLKGAYLGENSSEVLTIGGQIDGDEVDQFTANQIPNHVFRSEKTMEIVPLVVSPSSINESHLGMFVAFENVQFPLSLAGKTFLDPNDDFDTQRNLVSCTNGFEFPVETSSFCNFSQVPLPVEARGAISGVITQSFGGDERVMVLNEVADISFTDLRCDPVFEESFNSAIDNTDLNFNGWINYAEAGSVVWTEQVFRGNGYAEFNPFRSGDSSNIAWLITPEIDLDAQEGEILTFQTEHAYPDSGHEPLEVFISTDFNGTEAGISAATWQTLTFDVSYVVDYGNWFTFTDSGSIDLSSYTGTAFIAFKYTGSDTSNRNMTLHVENVLVKVP